VAPRELSAASRTQVADSSRAVLPDGVPSTPPPVPGTQTNGACLSWNPLGTVQLLPGGPPPGANAVHVDAGLGGLVAPGRGGAALGSALYLVTDTGQKFPVTSAEVAEKLGYPGDSSVPVDPGLLDLLPTGPVLDPGPVTG